MINILVLAIGLVVVYVLVKKLRNRARIALQDPRVAEYVAAMEAFLQALRPNQEVPLLPDVPTTPVPSPEPVSRPPSPIIPPDTAASLPVADPHTLSRSVDRMSTPRGCSARSSVAAAPTLDAAVSAPNLYPNLAVEFGDSMDDFQTYRQPGRAVSTTDEEVRLFSLKRNFIILQAKEKTVRKRNFEH